MGKHLVSWFVATTIYLSYGVMFIFGYVEEFLSYIKRKVLFFQKKKEPTQPVKKSKQLASLTNSFESFYIRKIYAKVIDTYNRPITTIPGTWIVVRDRWFSKGIGSELEYTGKEIKCLNMGSYNYLGFAKTTGKCHMDVIKSTDEFSVGQCSTRLELGTTRIHKELEAEIAKFVGKEDAIIFGMGFATNSTTIPLMAGKGSLIISDSLNHASLVCGSRLAHAQIRVFQHNDLRNLERVIRDSIIKGQPRKNRPWKKIIIIVEGIYSMEGEIAPLPEIVRLKKKYNCLLFVDEAHSIGAIGPTGRGIVEYFGINPDDVDILMGTFTKSFGSVGGYIAGNKDFINFLRLKSFGALYADSMSVPCVQQALSALRFIMYDKDGKKTVEKLRENSNYFRERLVRMGFEVMGDFDSPVIPIMLYCPAIFTTFSRECLQRDFVSVLPILLDELKNALDIISEVGDILMAKYRKEMNVDQQKLLSPRKKFEMLQNQQQSIQIK
ncbi:hypothetical protein M0811_07596 [Anaeramoeba ignava]|uniref:serine C-palmitoyltransferase n=1 Tax=Anaeramoeba ignava TaxID=1746090 RepID=A0A9Q0LLY0_ANAIG|nr:hypothetical protein M0811_07596 [Anaeramoeba ignava]